MHPQVTSGIGRKVPRVSAQAFRRTFRVGGRLGVDFNYHFCASVSGLNTEASELASSTDRGNL